MNPIGIMQGRLSPPLSDNPQYFPADRWEEEFPLAAELGFDRIEWLFDAGSQDTNPLLTEEGRERIRYITDLNGLEVSSLCADYFKDNSLATDDSSLRLHRTSLLVRLIENAADLGVECVLIPFLEGSTLERPEARRIAREALSHPLDTAANRGIALAVETDLPAPTLAKWLGEVDHPALGVYYDLGNAVALGFDPGREIPRLGEWLRGVHVKDRTLDGPNVPLGTGLVDFAACSEKLREAGYQGLLLLETVRGEDYVGDARRHLAFVKKMAGAMAIDQTPRSVSQ